MSTDGKDTACSSENVVSAGFEEEVSDHCEDEVLSEKKRLKPNRKVSFPDDDQIVTQYFEPADPWQDVATTSRAQLAAEYLESCRRHNTPPIECVLRQIREFPECPPSSCGRLARLSLSECALLGAAPVDALEAVLRRAQFRRLDIDHAAVDDEGAEALFDMVEYYESATVLSINGPRAFGIRGWQAASRMIKKSCQLSELEVSNHPLEAAHAPVLSRALHTILSIYSTVVPTAPLSSTVLPTAPLTQSCQLSELEVSNHPLEAAHAPVLSRALHTILSIYSTVVPTAPLSSTVLPTAPLTQSCQLSELEVSNHPLEAAHAPVLSRALHTILSIYSTVVPTAPLSSTVLPTAPLTQSCQLSELEVSNHPLEAAHAPVLSRALHTHSCRLRVLCLQRASIAGDALLCLVIALKSNNSLRELRLGDNRLGVADAAQLGSLLRYNNRLQLLDLSNNQIQDAGCGHIAAALADQAVQTPPSAAASPQDKHHCPLSGYESRGLSFLVLWNNQLTRNCSPHLSKALTSTSLCVLNVGRNAIGSEGVRALSGGGGALHSLGLQAARLGPDAAAALHHLIAHTPLQRLDLRDNKLGVASLQAIVSALKENTTITQIDLDDPPESSSSLTPETGAVSGAEGRLTREIRSLCRSREPPPDRPAHRKISLTCHTTCIVRALQARSPGEGEDPSSERRGGPARLRSPLPSPAGSPVPQPHSRFSVTRVTPEREGAVTPTTPTTPMTPPPSMTPPPNSPSPSSSRFKVVQVIEPPQIHIQSAEPRRSSSRFSVTRNYDSMYNPSLTHPAATNVASTNTDKQIHKSNSAVEVRAAVPLLTKTPNTTASDEFLCKSDKYSACDKVSVKDDVNGKIDRKDNKSDAKTESDVLSATKTDAKAISDPKPVDSAKNNVFKDKTEQVTYSEVIDDEVVKTKIEHFKNETEVSGSDKMDVEVKVVIKTESVKPAKVHADQNDDFRNLDDININEKRNDNAMKQIEAITEDLGHLIQEMKDLTCKTSVLKKGNDERKKECEVEVKIEDVPANIIRDNVVLKKNKSESSLDSPDLEVSRLMNKKLTGGPFCDSSSSLEISGSSMESLAEPIQAKPIIIQESIESDTELDRRKPDRTILSTESSLESNTSEMTPVNSGNFLNTSVSSNESVSPIIFGITKKIHDSLSSLEASVSSLDSARQERVMVTSADSGIEYSLQNPSEGNKDDNSSNEGTLTNNSSLKGTVKNDSCPLQDTLTSSPKRASSLLDVPALKSKGLDRMRKISWVAPSSSFHIPKPEPERLERVDSKIPSNLEKLLSLFQHPTSLFSRNTNEEEKKSASNTPPRKDSSLTSGFWTWGSSTEKDKDDKEDRDSSEATDSTLSERIQVSYVDESFSRKLDSKTPSTDTENTLSEFQSFPIQGNSENSDASQTEKGDRVTDITTDNLVQKSLVVSAICMENASSNGNKDVRACDIIDLIKPNDLNKNWTGDSNKNSQDTDKDETKIEREETKEPVRPRSFAAVLKASGSENSLDKQTSPEGQPVDKLPSKVIRGIKENISPENTLTSSMTNTKTLAVELAEKQVKNQPVVNAVWEVPTHLLEKDEMKAPIATIEETCDEAADNSVQLDFIDDIKFIDEKNVSADSGVTSLEGVEDKKPEKVRELESVDLGKDALSYLIYENQDFEPDTEQNVTDVVQAGSLAQELEEAEIKEKLLDLSPELVIDDAVEVPEVFVAKDLKGLRTSPVIPERAKLKKSNSLEELSQSDDSPKTKTIAFKIPETTPRDIPERRPKLRSRSGSSPKSLPETLNKPCPLTKMDSKKKKKVSSLGKMAKDSLLALNMTEEEIAEFRRSYKLTSVESLRSLESVSEDANSQSGTSADSRCRACLRQSQESLMSLDSITEDCRCTDDNEKERPGRVAR